MKNISRRYIGGFTLIELLIVVLIIGILSAVALPMYQGAVDKSRFSTLLPATKGIKDAQESVRMSTGLYTENMEDLEISMDNGELSFTFDVHNNLADPNLVRTTSPKLENVRLASYFDYNPMMAGQKHCEAKTGDKRANRLCGPLLQGQEFGETGDGYTRYLLDKDIDKPTCDDANRSWSSSQGKCYKDTATRCEALGMPALEGQDQCGYENKNGKDYGAKPLIIGAEGFCYSTGGITCAWMKVEEGGTCISTGGDSCARSTYNGSTALCNGSGYCGLWSTFDGGVCVGNGDSNCIGSTFKNGAVCYANAKNACGVYDSTQWSSFDDTSCCCGAYCPSTAPKCAASRCDPQYMK